MKQESEIGEGHIIVKSKHALKLSCAIAAAACSLSFYSPQAHSLEGELLQNGDFSQALTSTSWQTFGDISLSTNAPLGSSLQSAVVFNGSGDSNDAHLLQTFSTIPGREYAVTFRCAREGDTSEIQRLNTKILNGVAILYNADTTLDPNNNIVTSTYRFRAQSNSTTISFSDEQSTSNTNSAIQLDNISVIEGPGGLARDLMVWYDAGDTSTLSQTSADCDANSARGEVTGLLSSGDSIACLQDRSGNNYHALQSDAQKQPTFIAKHENAANRSTLNFIPNSSLNHTLAALKEHSGASTTFLVMQRDNNNLDGDAGVYSTSSATEDGHQIRFDSDSATFKAEHPSSDSLSSFGNTISLKPNLYTLAHDGSNEVITYTNGILTEVKSLNGQPANALGREITQFRLNETKESGPGVNADIAELIVYNQRLKPCEIYEVNRYLAKKYQRPFGGVPGGVGCNSSKQSLALWLKANDGGNNWSDNSPKHVTINSQGDPKANSAQLNFNPSIALDGINDFYELDNAEFAPGISDRAIYVVATPHHGAQQQYLVTLGAAGTPNTFSVGITDSLDEANPTYTPSLITANGESTANTSLYSYNRTQIFSYSSNAQQIGLHVDGHAQTVLGQEFAGALLNPARGHIGAYQNGETLRSWKGSIAEVIVYNESTHSPINGTSERELIESYLAMKYGLALAPSSGVNMGVVGMKAHYLSVGDVAQGLAYDPERTVGMNQHIATIVRDDTSGLNQKQAVSSSGGAMLNLALGDRVFTTNKLNESEFENDLDYFTISTNGEKVSQDAQGHINLPMELKTAKKVALKRVWQAQSNGHDQTITLAFDLEKQTVLDPNSELNSYSLLINRTESSFSSVDAELTPTRMENNRIEFVLNAQSLSTASESFFFTLAGLPKKVSLDFVHDELIGLEEEHPSLSDIILDGTLYYDELVTLNVAGSALRGSDFLVEPGADSSLLTIPAASYSNEAISLDSLLDSPSNGMFAFDLIDDSNYELNETVIISLEKSSAFIPSVNKEDPYSISSTLVIVDNDPLPTVGYQIASQSVSEGDNGSTLLLVELALDSISGVDALIPYTASVEGDTSVTTVRDGVLSIPAGEQSGTVAIALNPNTAYDGDTIVTLSINALELGSVQAGTLMDYVLTIIDDDKQKVFASLSAKLTDEVDGNLLADDLSRVGAVFVDGTLTDQYEAELARVATVDVINETETVQAAVNRVNDSVGVLREVLEDSSSAFGSLNSNGVPVSNDELKMILGLNHSLVQKDLEVYYQEAIHHYTEFDMPVAVKDLESVLRHVNALAAVLEDSASEGGALNRDDMLVSKDQLMAIQGIEFVNASYMTDYHSAFQLETNFKTLPEVSSVQAIINEVNMMNSDDDGDSVINSIDLCMRSSQNLDVDVNGCATLSSIVREATRDASQSFTLDELENLGLQNIGVNNTTQAQYEFAIATSSPRPATLAELQALVDAVNTEDLVTEKPAVEEMPVNESPIADGPALDDRPESNSSADSGGSSTLGDIYFLLFCLAALYRSRFERKRDDSLVV